MRRFPWILTILTAVAIALLIGLGVWQVQRLRWKEGLITAAQAAATRPLEPLDAVLAGGDVEFRKVLMVCPGLATAPYVELQSIHDGQAGVRLISVCRPAGRADGMLIDRGFIADPETARPRVLASTLPLVLIGELRRTPPPGALTPPPANNRFYARDNAAMAKALGVEGPVRPETVLALSAINPEVPALRPSAPPAAFSNNHFGYALTWFGLAIALAGFYVALLRRRLNDGRPSSRPAPRAER